MPRSDPHERVVRAVQLGLVYAVTNQQVSICSTVSIDLPNGQCFHPNLKFIAYGDDVAPPANKVDLERANIAVIAISVSMHAMLMKGFWPDRALLSFMGFPYRSEIW